MTSAVSAKELLAAYNAEHYRAFTLNDDPTISLPEISSVPGIGASTRHDVYEKTISHPCSAHHIKFMTKNKQPHAFLWQTNAEKIKEGVRWGIIKTHSITGKVISALGHYRALAHESVTKGMVRYSMALKLKLLDLYQDRFEALQDLESLVNQDNTHEVYENEFGLYIKKLQGLDQSLEQHFGNIETPGFDENTIAQIRSDLGADVDRATAYLASLKKEDNLHAYNQARGPQSILEFVKQQMIQNLYELEGINKDITYSNKRSFALTSGELNNVIMDARKEIDDHQADLRNSVTAKHHGDYSSKENSSLLSYDFSTDQLTPTREREVLLAISFIEGWDKLNLEQGKTPTVSNATGEEKLDTVVATNWKNHRNWKMFFISAGLYLLNMVASIFVSTHPWEEKSWKNPDFQLIADQLRKNARPNEPLWRKPFGFFKQIFNAVIDMFKGIRDSGVELVIRMPADVLNDWESTQVSSSLGDVLKGAEADIVSIQNNEKDRLDEILEKCKYTSPPAVSKSSSQWVGAEYELGPAEQDDILTAVARGLNRFGGVFSHTIFSKSPVRGLLFTSAYAVGVSAIYMPSMTASVFGANYVNWFTNVSYAMGSSRFAAAIAGGSTQAHLVGTGWDTVMHGPNGDVARALYRVGEDPLTLGSYFGAAYGLGYVLANGIGGYKIPWLSEHLKDGVGAVPEASYPVIGGKAAVVLYEGLMTEQAGAEPQLQLTSVELKSEDDKDLIERFRFVSWLTAHAQDLPKLESRQLFRLSQHIQTRFSVDESKSLLKLLYPETHHSIAFHLFSPLAYIPALLRVGISAVLNVAAKAGKKPLPWEPIKRASGDLLGRIKKDLSRLIVFTTYILNLPYMLVASICKVPVSIGTMIIGRIAGRFNAKPVHSIHRAFAAVHNVFRSVAEFFYPVSVLKEVVSAHPAHTIKNIESSYVNLIKKLGGVMVIGSRDERSLANSASQSSPLDNRVQPEYKVDDGTMAWTGVSKHG